MGINQLLMFSVMASMFYSGGKIINSSIDDEGKSTINSRDVFTAIFTILMGSM